MTLKDNNTESIEVKNSLQNEVLLSYREKIKKNFLYDLKKTIFSIFFRVFPLYS